MSEGGIKMGVTPPHPGAVIRTDAAEELGLSVAAAARILGVRRATLSDLVNGNASLSPEMALRVERAFGLCMDLLLRMQPRHEATQMRARRRDRCSAVSAAMIGIPHWGSRRHARGAGGYLRRFRMSVFTFSRSCRI